LFILVKNLYKFDTLNGNKILLEDKMKVFDAQGKSISKEDWIELYKQFYFLNGLTHGNRITKRNQTSIYVENEILNILTNGIISHADVKKVLAWKKGEIDHIKSQSQIIYREGWNNRNIDKYGRDYTEAIDYIANNLNSLKVAEYNLSYGTFKQLPNIGHTYAINMIFFISNGSYPIYDRFAHQALLAIKHEKPINTVITFPEQHSWENYLAYCKLVEEIFGTQTISRDIDRALWSYGHFFKIAEKSQKKNDKKQNIKISSMNEQSHYNLVKNIKQELAEQYLIKSSIEEKLFLEYATQYKQWANYIAGYYLTNIKKWKSFGPTDIIQTLQEEIIPNYYNRSGFVESGLLTADVEINSSHSKGFPCLRRLSRGYYELLNTNEIITHIKNFK